MEREFDLGGVMEKVRRAMEHHDELQRANISWMLESGYDLAEVVAVDRRTSSYVIRGVRLEPPLRIASIFGDLVHNLRSALDHLARRLLLANGATPEDDKREKTSFPLVMAAGNSWVPSIASKQGSISPEAARVLDAVQPYHWGARSQQHPLVGLSRLDNIDKHRLLHTAVLRARGGAVFLKTREDIVMPHHNRYPISLDGVKSQRVPVRAGDLHDEAFIAGEWSGRLYLAKDVVQAGLALDALGADVSGKDGN